MFAGVKKQDSRTRQLLLALARQSRTRGVPTGQPRLWRRRTHRAPARGREPSSRAPARRSRAARRSGRDASKAGTPAAERAGGGGVPAGHPRTGARAAQPRCPAQRAPVLVIDKRKKI